MGRASAQAQHTVVAVKQQPMLALWKHKALMTLVGAGHTGSTSIGGQRNKRVRERNPIAGTGRAAGIYVESASD